MSQPNGQPSSRPDVHRGRHQMPPTLATVADEAGVSRQTVSNALNNPDLLRPETLERVQSVIERLGYSPNRAARQLRSGSSHLIGLRFEAAQEGTSNALMDRFLHSLVETASHTGHHVLLFSGDPEDPLDGYDDLLRSTAVDAFVVTDTYAGTPQSVFLQERGAPFVAFGRPVGRARRRPRVERRRRGPRCADRDRAPDRAGAPPDRLARLGEDLPHRRRTGAAAGRARWRQPGEDVSGLGVRLTDNVDAARMAAHELMQDPSITGFVCASDTLGIGVLHACAERGLRPGADIGVVGFDDSLAAQVTWPGLTSVRQPLEQVAVELVRTLHLVLAHKPIVDKGQMLQPELVVRRSSQRADSSVDPGPVRTPASTR